MHSTHSHGVIKKNMFFLSHYNYKYNFAEYFKNKQYRDVVDA